jgi:hypothetical protein
MVPAPLALLGRWPTDTSGISHMSSATRARLGLTAVAAASLVLGAAATAQAAPANATARPATAPATPTVAYQDGVDFKTRAVKALLAPTAGSGDAAPELSPSSASVAAAGSDVPLADAPADAPSLAPQSLGADAAASCATLNLDWTPTNDHVWVHWDSTGATSYAVWRQRLDGAWKQIGTTAQTSFLDTTTNPRGLFTYRVVAGGLTCDLADWASMSTDDGLGVPDAVYGGASSTGEGTGQLMEQDIYSYAMATGIGGSDPAFSPDGRRVAVVTHAPGGAWYLDIRDLGRPDVGIISLTMPLNTVPADPAWSPDGRSIAYTGYTVDPDTSDLTGAELRLWVPAKGSDNAVNGSAGLIQPDWRSGTTLIAAGFNEGEGLYTIASAGGTKSAMIPGSDNAGYPEVAPDGRVYFVTGDGTNFAVKAVVPQANDQVSEVRSSTTHWFERPRVSPDGTIYVVEVDGHDLANPDDNTFSVIYGTFGPDGMPASSIGTPRDASLVGFSGYDVRQPKSKGTSDYVGNANPEILGKDSAGRLWAYSGSDTSPVAGRTSMGGGWNMFNQVVAAGDLDGDDRADVLGRKPDGTLWLYHGLGGAKVQPGKQVGSGWSSYVILAPGDFDGDGTADLLGRDSRYQLWLYPGKGDGTFGARTLVTSGWGGFSAIIGFGDFNYDGKADILGRERSTGFMYLYPGNGHGGITGRTKLGAGWNTLNAFAAPVLYGINPGLFGRLPDGSMRYYQVIGDGRFDADAVYPAGGGWGSFQITG